MFPRPIDVQHHADVLPATTALEHDVTGHFLRAELRCGKSSCPAFVPGNVKSPPIVRQSITPLHVEPNLQLVDLDRRTVLQPKHRTLAKRHREASVCFAVSHTQQQRMEVAAIGSFSGRAASQNGSDGSGLLAVPSVGVTEEVTHRDIDAGPRGTVPSDLHAQTSKDLRGGRFDGHLHLTNHTATVQGDLLRSASVQNQRLLDRCRGHIGPCRFGLQPCLASQLDLVLFRLARRPREALHLGAWWIGRVYQLPIVAPGVGFETRLGLIGLDQLDQTMLGIRNGEQRARIALAEHQGVWNRSIFVVEELGHRHVDDRLFAVIEEDLHAGLGVFRADQADENPVDAARTVDVQQHVASRGKRDDLVLWRCFLIRLQQHQAVQPEHVGLDGLRIAADVVDREPVVFRL